MQISRPLPKNYGVRERQRKIENVQRMWVFVWRCKPTPRTRPRAQVPQGTMLHQARKTNGRAGRDPLPGTIFLLCARRARGSAAVALRSQSTSIGLEPPRPTAPPSPRGTAKAPRAKETQAHAAPRGTAHVHNRSAAAITRHTRMLGDRSRTKGWSGASVPHHRQCTASCALSALASPAEPLQIQSCSPRGKMPPKRTPGRASAGPRTKRPVVGPRQNSHHPALRAGYLPQDRDATTPCVVCIKYERTL